MSNMNTKIKLPSVSTFDEFEKLKLRQGFFEDIAKEILLNHGIPDKPLELLEATNVVFSQDNQRILKIYPPFHQEQFRHETMVMNHLKNKLSVKTPIVEYQSTLADWSYIITNQLDGVVLEGLWEKLSAQNKITLIREIGALIQEVHALPVNGLEAIDCHWPHFISRQINQCVIQHQLTELPDSLITQIPNYLENAKSSLPVFKKPVLLTGEYTPMNLLVLKQSDEWHLCGMIDFGDCMLGLPEYDLLGPGAFLIQGNKKLLKEFLLSFGFSFKQLTPLLSRQLTALMLLHRYSNLKVQIRIDNWKNKVNSIEDLENLVWGF